MKPKLCVGIPFYANQDGAWWSQLAEHMTSIGQQVDFRGLLAVGQMAADHSRNLIVKEFLARDAEWLMWIDSDTVVPIGAIPRLLGVGKTLVSGVYYGKNPPHPPIAYHIHQNAWIPINKQINWEKGEILPVDACGMGCLLSHRSVFEDIADAYEVYQLPGGGMVPVHKSDILGEIEEDGHHEHDGKVYRGQLRQRLTKLTLDQPRFPYFSFDHGRTEDFWFFELARRVGHKPWLDTSVECAHLREVPFQGKDYRDLYGH